MRISQLDGLRVALWGWGREGQAAWRALRDRESGVGGSRHAVRPRPLTLFCRSDEVERVLAFDDAHLTVETEATAARLSAFDVVIKSPGISPYSPEAQAAAAAGTRFVGGTALWFAERLEARTLCITGTKGKSTTSALTAHLLRAGGLRTALAGNIGLPLLELLGAEAEAWVIELSSYQTRDVAAAGVSPNVAVVTNIHPEHLDWHGGEARYVEDKLALLTQARPGIAVLDALDARLAALELPHSEVHWFNRPDGWHLRGEVLHRGELAVLDTGALPLPGTHNRRNLCAALAAIEALGVDAVPLAAAAADFVPLPHRLQTLGERGGLLWVNDSISTTPQAAIAALEAFAGSRVAILVGGHDRGLDWTAFATYIRAAPPQAVITMGANGPRIHAALAASAAAGGFALRAAQGLPAAVAAARDLLGESCGLVLLSPGAPSFGPYRDYTERGRHFAALAGFDPDRIAALAGLGIA